MFGKRITVTQFRNIKFISLTVSRARFNLTRNNFGIFKASWVNHKNRISLRKLGTGTNLNQGKYSASDGIINLRQAPLPHAVSYIDKGASKHFYFFNIILHSRCPYLQGSVFCGIMYDEVNMCRTTEILDTTMCDTELVQK